MALAARRTPGRIIPWHRMNAAHLHVRLWTIASDRSYRPVLIRVHSRFNCRTVAALWALTV
jgi:hypothetical protein